MSRPILQYPKPERLESPAYLKWIRQLPCVINKCYRRTEAHHVVFDGQGRIGSKVSDFQVVPCCDLHHRQYHGMGREKFEDIHGLDFAQIVIRLLSEYIREIEQ